MVRLGLRVTMSPGPARRCGRGTAMKVTQRISGHFPSELAAGPRGFASVLGIREPGHNARFQQRDLHQPPSN